MASEREPSKSPKRAREPAASALPVDAQAQETPKAQENAISEDVSTKSGRAQAERAAQEARNTIRLARTRGKSQAHQTQERSAAEERSNAEPIPRALPEHINSRYLKVGNDYHFPDGTVAFRDRGDAVSTKLENKEVIGDLIAIAQERGWSSIEITGTERFRKEAWQAAQLAGLNVRNYEASELERKQLVWRMSGERDRAKRPPSRASAPGAPEAPDVERPDPSLQTQSRTEPPPSGPNDRIYRGRLIDHGVDRYQFDPRQEESYYVVLDTPRGEQLIWGKDLQRAFEESLSHVREGQDVLVRQLGAKPVTVKRPVRDAEGQTIDHTEVKTHLNRWSVETEDFLKERAKLAEVVRDVGIDAKAAVLKHPELAGTYGDLHAARLVALHQNYKHPSDIDRFVNRTREAIAQEIERGEALSPPIARARYQGQSPSAPRTQQRVQERVL
jgi:putative DNA primase/helicase